MGFFSDLKDDLSQAVNELMPEEEADQQDAMVNEEAEQQSAAAQEVSVPQPEENPEMVNGFDDDLGRMLDKVEEIEIRKEPPAQAPVEAAPVKETAKEELPAEKNTIDEVAVLTASTIINGNIATEGNLEVRGSIVGNVEALGKLNITGAVQGNSQAAEIYAEGAKIVGELRSNRSVKVGQSTVIIGNIFASSAVVAGAVKGDIDVKGPVILDSSAIVMGDIKSKSVQINNGAVVEGMCSQCYADVNPSAFFDDYKNTK